MDDDEINDALKAEDFMNGVVMCEIEHLLIMRLHDNNTILEIGHLKYEIHGLMMDAYNRAQAR